MRLFTLFLLFFIPYTAWADMNQEEIQSILADRIDGLQIFTKSGIFIQAAQEQNRKGMSLEEIKKIDTEWKAGKSPLMNELQETKAGKYLKNIIVQQGDVYNEAFLTDAQGANVAAFPPTSDYWQGDEEKFTAAFNGGSGKTFIGPIEFDESTKTHAVQVSVPILYGKEVIGIFVIGIKLSQIEAEKLQQKSK